MFKKLAAMLIGALMAAMPLAGSALADYTLGDFPAPFVEGGTAGFLIVVGSGGTAAGIAQDLAGLINVAARLGGETVTTEGGSAVSISGGVQIIAPGTKFNYNNDSFHLRPTGLGDSDLPVVLADGIIDENEGNNPNDETYTQVIGFTDGVGLSVFETDDNVEEKPAGTYLKFPEGTGNYMYTYTLEFSNEIDIDCTSDTTAAADLQNVELEIQGKEYTISGVTCNADDTIDSITLLGGAAEQTVNDEETVTVTLDGKDYKVTPSVYYSDSVTFTVEHDGTVETTNELDEAETEELGDGTEIGVRDILYSSKETKTSAVTFYLGAQKVLLDDDSEIKLNDDEIEDYDTAVTFANTSAGGDTLSSITITVVTEDTIWLGEGDEWVDPVFGAFKYVFGGTSAFTEEFKAVTSGNDGTLTITDIAGNEIEIPFVSYDGSGKGYPGDDLLDTTYDVVVDGQSEGTANAGGNLLLANNDMCTGASAITACEGIMFLAVNTGGEARIIEIKDIDTTANKIDFKDHTTSDVWEDKTYVNGTESTISLGSFMQVKVLVDETARTINVTQMNTFAGTGDFMTSLAGEVAIAYNDGDNSTVTLYSDDGDLLGSFTFLEASNDLTISTGLGGYLKEEDSDIRWDLDDAYWGALFEWDEENDDDMTVYYPAEPTEFQVFVAPTSATLSSSGDVGRSGVIKSNIAVVDTDATSTQKSNYNMILGGGPAVNKLTAEALGLTYPTYGADSGIPTDGYMIELIPDAFVEGKYALVIAGWEADQTTEAMSKIQADMATVTGNVYYYPAAPAEGE